MTFSQAVKLLGVKASQLTDAQRLHPFERRGSGNHHEYTEETIRLLKRYFDAKRELAAAKRALGGGKIRPRVAKKALS